MNSHIMLAAHRRLPICPIILVVLLSVLLLMNGTQRSTANPSPDAPAQKLAALLEQDSAFQKPRNRPAMRSSLRTHVGDSASSPAGRYDRPMAYDRVGSERLTTTIAQVSCPTFNSPLVISRFRENGPAGPADEFVEIFNRSNSPLMVSTFSNDPGGSALGIGVFTSAGNGTASNRVSLVCRIPGNTVIEGRSYYLCGGKAYSLGRLGNNGGTSHSVPDQTIGTDGAVVADIPNDAGLILLDVGSDNVGTCVDGNAGCPCGFAVPGGSPTVLDSVGFNRYGAGAPASFYPSLAGNFCKGTCLQPVGDVSLPGACTNPSAAFPVIAAGPACYGQSGQYEFLRRQTSFDPSMGTLHRDTGNNADDFILVSPNPATNVGQAITGISGITPVLGAAGPQGSAAPPDTPLTSLTRAPFDVGSQLGPRNAERRYNLDPTTINPANNPLGTFALRFQFINNSGSNITGLRLRVDNVSTLCGPQTATMSVGTGDARNMLSSSDCGTGSFTAILKLLNSAAEVVVDSEGTAWTVNGTVMEDLGVALSSPTPPGIGPLSPLGGGVDNSIIVTHADQQGINGGFVGDGVTGGVGNFGMTMGTSGPTRVLPVKVKFGVVRSGRLILLITPMAKELANEPRPSGTIMGRVVDPRNTPVRGAEVRVSGQPAVLTNSNGEFNILGLAATKRLAVSFSAPGFMDTTRVYEVGESSRITGNVVVIWPRTAPVSLNATQGGKLTFPGGTISFPPLALVDELGRQLQGEVRVAFSVLDVSDPNQLRIAPGDFTARMRDDTIRQLETFGVFEVFVEDSNGQRANLAPGKTAAIELFIPPTLRPNAPRAVGLFSFDKTGGLWIEEGTFTLTEGQVYTGVIPDILSEWNIDMPLITTCLKLQILDENGWPAPLGTKVEAEGVDYIGLSPIVYVEDPTGVVCLLVKTSAKVSVVAYHPTVNHIQSCPLEFLTHPYTANDSDCENSAICPVETTTIKMAGGAFHDDLSSDDPVRWERSEGENDSPFNVCWLLNNIPVPNGILTLVLDQSTCPSPSTRPFASGEYRTNACYRYGTYEANFKAASGDGLITSFFTYTGTFGKPTHHEIDVEIFGKNPRQLQANYYVAGVPYLKPVDLPFDASEGFHTYKFVWTPGSIKWCVDNNPTPIYEVSGSVPSLPSKIFVNLWAADNSPDGMTLGTFDNNTPVHADYDWIKYSPP